MQCFLYFLEGLNRCNIGQKDFHQRILNVMREAAVKNFSLHFESSEEIFSEYKTFVRHGGNGTSVQLLVLPHLTQGSWRKLFVLEIIWFSLYERSWLHELGFTDAESKAQLGGVYLAATSEKSQWVSQSLWEGNGAAKVQKGVGFVWLRS